MARILLIEDDARIRDSLMRALRDRGHAVQPLGAALPALQMAIDEPPDVVVLDLGLPDIDGREWLRMLRAVSDVPVIVATARDDEDGIVRTLDAGADDYLVKPFAAAQLEARIRAVLRRGADEQRGQSITVGSLRIDPAAREVTLDGEPVELARLEFELLLYLARRAGEVVPRPQLLADVWQQPYGGADKTLDVHLSWLRRKLGETAADPRYLHTVRGVGIKLQPPA